MGSGELACAVTPKTASRLATPISPRTTIPLMPSLETPAHAGCECGAVRLTTHGTLARFYCHRSICQRLNQSAYGDPVFVWRKDVEVEDPSQLAWRRYRRLPINLNRGTCRTCDTLVLEHVTASPISVVIGNAWDDQERLPSPKGHIFYESRLHDVDDELPKRSGYLSSQLAVTRWVLEAIRGH